MYVMTSSLRTAPLEETLANAKTLAAKLGISRVTDTTWLDGIGIPVFASIRPDSLSLCVNAGKGMRREEAQVGAYMEAIEFAMAEYRNSTVTLHTATPRQTRARHDDYDLVDLCPLLGYPIEPDGPMMWVDAEDLRTGATVPVPAEIVFNPFPENRGQRVFGTGSNGLCSGNSVDEATLHGLCEVVERDIRSFNHIRDRSRIIDMDVPSSHPAQLSRRIENAGLRAVLRFTPNEFELPFFEAFVLEPSVEAPVPIAHGCGVHLVRDIAAVRALAEAAQSRLTLIHGGRDDIIDRFDYFEQGPSEPELDAIRRTRDSIVEPSGRRPYSGLPDGYRAETVDASLDALVERLEGLGFSKIFRVRLTDETSPLAVVRVIVPGLECFQPSLRRVGRRLAAFIEEEPRVAH